MEETVRDLLDAGARISNDEYVACHRRYVLRTFFFMCQQLSQWPAGTWLSCHSLTIQLREQLGMAQLPFSPASDPFDWFGYLWTVAEEGGAPEFPAIIPYVLACSGERPYRYRLQDEWYTIIRCYFFGCHSVVAYDFDS